MRHGSENWNAVNLTRQNVACSLGNLRCSCSAPPSSPASTPCSLLSPNSIIGLPLAACTTREAFVAIMVCRLTVLSRKVSTSCASIMGAVTRIKGSLGKASEPSGIAQTSPVNLKPRKVIEKIRVETLRFKVIQVLFGERDVL